MRSAEGYPVVIQCDGPRDRPSQALLLANGLWRVDWVGGLVSVYRADPRDHLKLGYDPRHLRYWQASPECGPNRTSYPALGRGARRS